METPNRSQKIRLAAAKTGKNSNLVFFADVRKIIYYYSQKTVGYLDGYTVHARALSDGVKVLKISAQTAL